MHGIIDGTKYPKNVIVCYILMLYCWSNFACNILDYNDTLQIDADTSIMTYRGHCVNKSLIRAKFSPLETTGQRYIYTGCGTGRLVSECFYLFLFYVFQ